jgi:glycosyltransferase involved in cell wall biosynthesis
MMPKVTILLPFYNAEKTLGRAIESVIQQTYRNFELILIDNNSNDQSAEMARKFCSMDERCNLIHEEKQGVVHAFKKGIRLADGQFIARMDADDESFPDRLMRQITYLRENGNCDVVAGLAEYKAHKPETEGFQRYVIWSNQIQSHDEIRMNIFIESPIINPTVMWRKSVSDTYGAYEDGDFPEDYELWLRWMSEEVKFHKLNFPVIKWYDSDQRLTRTDPRYSDEAFFTIKTLYLAKWLKQHNPFHPKVVVWGASKISRKRADLLLSHGIDIAAYIDISMKRQVGKKIIFHENLPPSEEIFVLVYLKEESMRHKTVQFLNARNFVEGVNYLLVS